MTLADWLSRLEKLHFKTIDMGLERVKQAAQRLGVIAPGAFVFTVAGTNGKGSTSTLIHNVLLEAGYHVGLYTSPHLIQFNERICIDGQICSDQELISAFEAIEATRGEISLTYFEFTTLAAAWIFQRKKLDAWVLEVGLGGRLDAVNIWDPDIAVVTSIDLDHQQWLGENREAIGIEKVGIGRPGKPLVMGDPNPPLSVVEHANSQAMELYLRNREFSVLTDQTEWRADVSAGQSRTVQQIEHLPYPQIYLDNALSALQALVLSTFTITQPQLSKALMDTRLTGRQQIVHEAPAVMLDVGHNPHAARALTKSLLSSEYKRVHCIVGMLNDKAVTETLLELLACVDTWYPVNAASSRGAPASEISDLLTQAGATIGRCSTHPGRCCEQLMTRLSKNDLIVVFGSFYTVSEVIQYCNFAKE